MPARWWQWVAAAYRNPAVELPPEIADMISAANIADRIGCTPSEIPDRVTPYDVQCWRVADYAKTQSR